MKLWWLANSVRLGAEKVAVEKLVRDENWFAISVWCINRGRLTVEGVIIAHGEKYPVRLVYPDQFPSVPAWVEPQDPEVQWSIHQYGKGGALCLELRPDNWVTEATGADVLRSAYNLLRTENPSGDGEHGRVVSAHRVGDVQSYDWGEEPVLIGAGCLDRIRNGCAQDLRALRWMREDGVWPILIFDAVDRARPLHPPSSDLGTFRIEIPVLVTKAEKPDPIPTDRVGLAAVLQTDFDLAAHQGAIVVMVVGSEKVTAIHSWDQDSVFVRKLIILPDDSGLRSGRADSAVGKQVAVIGMGSVGSKVAEILLRSGVSRLVLVDGDVFLPANLERHILDWRDVGFRKVMAVRRRLLHIMAGANIEVIASNLDWQRSARTHAGHIDMIAECDLIIDVTGDPPTALMLGALAAENDKPFVSAQVFEGGLGALIARSLPGYDPPYVSGRAAYNAYCEQLNVTPPSSGVGNYEAISEDGTPMVADDAAATITAGHTARLVLDVLDSRDDLGEAWLLMGFRKGWLFNGHGHTISLNVGHSVHVVEAEEDIEALAFANTLAKEAIDAAKTSS